MNRRAMLAFLPIIPVAGALAVVMKKRERPVPLPIAGELEWGETINKAIRELEDRIDRR